MIGLMTRKISSILVFVLRQINMHMSGLHDETMALAAVFLSITPPYVLILVLVLGTVSVFAI